MKYHFSPVAITADFVYVRLHGPKQKYSGSYSDEELKRWADKCNEWAKDGKDVFLYFANDQNGYAPFNAITLKKLSSQ